MTDFVVLALLGVLGFAVNVAVIWALYNLAVSAWRRWEDGAPVTKAITDAALARPAHRSAINGQS